MRLEEIDGVQVHDLLQIEPESLDPDVACHLGWEGEALRRLSLGGRSPGSRPARPDRRRSSRLHEGRTLGHVCRRRRVRGIVRPEELLGLPVGHPFGPRQNSRTEGSSRDGRAAPGPISRCNGDRGAAPDSNWPLAGRSQPRRAISISLSVRRTGQPRGTARSVVGPHGRALRFGSMCEPVAPSAGSCVEEFARESSARILLRSTRTVRASVMILGVRPTERETEVTAR